MSSVETMQVANVAKARVNPATEEKQDAIISALGVSSNTREDQILHRKPSSGESVYECVAGEREIIALAPKDSLSTDAVYDLAVLTYPNSQRFESPVTDFFFGVELADYCNSIRYLLDGEDFLTVDALDVTADGLDGTATGIGTTYNGNLQ